MKTKVIIFLLLAAVTLLSFKSIYTTSNNTESLLAFNGDSVVQSCPDTPVSQTPVEDDGPDDTVRIIAIVVVIVIIFITISYFMDMGTQ